MWCGELSARPIDDVPDIALNVDGLDNYGMDRKVCQIGKAAGRDDAVIIELDDGLCFSIQSETCLHFTISRGEVPFSCCYKQYHLVKPVRIPDFELHRDAC